MVRTLKFSKEVNVLKTKNGAGIKQYMIKVCSNKFEKLKNVKVTIQGEY